MLDIAWPELMVVGAVALVAIGPKDLPKVMHTLGVWTGKVRRAVIAIQHDFERLAAEAEKAEEKELASKAPPSKQPSSRPSGEDL